MKTLLIFLLCSVSVFGACVADSSCESPIIMATQMSMANIKDEFNKVNDKIKNVETKYDNINIQLDKEIAYLEKTLAIEMYIYQELDEARHNINQLNEIDGANLSIMLGEYEK